MAAFLYRLGRFAFRRRWLVVGLWLAVLAAAATSAATLSGPTSDAFRIPGTPSQEAIDLLQARFPATSAEGATARVVFAAPAGQRLTGAATKTVIEQAVTELDQAPRVAAVADPFRAGTVNPAGTVAFAQATYRVPAQNLTDDDRDALARIAERVRDRGLTVEIGGDAVQAPPEQGLSEAIGVAVAAVVLIITFGSLVAAGLPLLTALFGIGIGFGVITAATGFIDLSSTTPVLALMLGLAVSIDYALFIVSRYRHELAAGHEPPEAAGRAIGTAGSAVVFAGLTVVIALAALSVVGVPFLTQMGVAAAFTVAVAVVIALTLLPAALGFAGRRVLCRSARLRGGPTTAPRETRARHTDVPRDDAATDPRRIDAHRDGPTTAPQHNGESARGRVSAGTRWARAVARRPVVTLLVAVAALGLAAIPALDLRLGMPDDGTAAPATTQRKAYDLVTAGFGAGFNGPLTVVVTAPAGAARATADRVGQRISGLPGVAVATTAAVNPAGDTALLTVIPTGGPGDPATKDLVRTVRRLDGGIAGVTGLTAINIDISTRVADSLIPYLAVVVGLAFLLLLLVFRSLLVPIKATLGFLLSVAATFGAVVAVFQWGWAADLLGVQRTGPILSFLPIILIGIVFGLAMDYQVFLVTRMREDHVHGAAPRDAVITGFGAGARVVTAAAAIMISVFAGFILAPDPVIMSIGFALAVAVLVDAFVVRMTIVPAVMTLLGPAAWWLPGRLNRILPDVDIEGRKLDHERGDGAAGPVVNVPERASA
ncbi:MMPL family transporter [Actinoplanes sp. NPDC049265]|uniref:MMPL family transporter n=1 Tax=Actinoplanes sp. NPDC049265 TaxID=3363902 RepID=UPI0037220E4E